MSGQIDGPRVRITPCADGPLIVRGDFTIYDADGDPIETPRRTVALCRCGISAIKPWCDGTHQALRIPHRLSDTRATAHDCGQSVPQARGCSATRV